MLLPHPALQVRRQDGQELLQHQQLQHLLLAVRLRPCLIQQSSQESAQRLLGAPQPLGSGSLGSVGGSVQAWSRAAGRRAHSAAKTEASSFSFTVRIPVRSSADWASKTALSFDSLAIVDQGST